MKMKKGWYALFVVPLMIPFLLTVVVPFFQGIGYSFVSWNGMAKTAKVFVGFQNYMAVFSDKRFLDSLVRTTLFTVVTVAIVNTLALAFALWTTSRIKARNAGRAMLFMPYLIGGLILGYVWNYILGYGMSLVANATNNSTLFFNWLSNKQYALYAMIVVATWQMAGYMMIIYIAGLEAISGDVLEAAQIDGASGWQTFWKITVPLLKPTIVMTTIMSINGTLQLFDESVNLTSGGPANSTITMSHYIYNGSFGEGVANFGYASAMSVVVFIMVAILAFINLKVGDKRD